MASAALPTEARSTRFVTSNAPWQYGSSSGVMTSRNLQLASLGSAIQGSRAQGPTGQPDCHGQTIDLIGYRTSENLRIRRAWARLTRGTEGEVNHGPMVAGIPLSDKREKFGSSPRTVQPRNVRCARRGIGVIREQIASTHLGLIPTRWIPTKYRRCIL